MCSSRTGVADGAFVSVMEGSYLNLAVYVKVDADTLSAAHHAGGAMRAGPTVPNCHIPSRIATLSCGQHKPFLCETTIPTYFTPVVSGLGCGEGSPLQPGAWSRTRTARRRSWQMPGWCICGPRHSIRDCADGNAPDWSRKLPRHLLPFRSEEHPPPPSCATVSGGPRPAHHDSRFAIRFQAPPLERGY